ncbi:MAG: MBL fold metallo-hydrolase [Desulfobacterales bacterium]
MLLHSELIDDIDGCALENDEFAVWWLGQHSFVLKHDEKILYFDPFLADHSGRLVPSLLDASEIKHADVIFGSHDHIDHIDHDAWKQIAPLNKQTRFVVPELLRDRLLEELAIDPAQMVGLDDDLRIDIEGIHITGVASAHEFLDRDEATQHFPYLGYIVDVNGLMAYHSGDTCIYEGIQQKLRPRHFDVVFVPINGRDAVRLRSGCIGNMTYQEAADLCGAIEPDLIIPGHYGMFAANTIDPELFSEYMKVKYPDLQVCLCSPGTRHVFKRKQEE